MFNSIIPVLQVVCLGFVMCGMYSNQCLAAGQPNVVFILVDDYGWRDLGIEGSTFYETPNIDKLAKSGMRFTRGYANCQVCSPSRASILTGVYTTRHGITDYLGAPEGKNWKRNTVLLPAPKAQHLPQSYFTLGEAFQHAGYKTFFAGKWHLGGTGSLPTDHGFDLNLGGLDHGSPPGGFFSPFKNTKLPDLKPGESLPLRLGNETAKFIREHQDKPFLAYLSFYSVHAPLQTTQALWQKYQKKASTLTKVDHRFKVDRTLPVRQVQDHPVYAGMVETMDQAVGIVLNTLDELKLTEKTIVVFTSDNGGVAAGDGNATCNLPLRGGKGRQWEGGVREPFYIRWPGVVKPESVTDAPVIHMDLYPTLVDIAGVKLPAEAHQVDGVSLVPVLSGGKLAERALYWHYPHYGNQGGEPSSIMLKDDWKLIHYYEDGRNELYHVTRDIGEEHDLAPTEVARTTEMWHQLEQWLVETKAIFPAKNPNYNSDKAKEELATTHTKGLENLEREAAGFLKPDFEPNKDWWKSALAE